MPLVMCVLTNGIKWNEMFKTISFHFIPLVMCVFYFQSKLTLKVSTHMTNVKIINNMHSMYIAEMYTIPFESYIISSVYISAIYIQCMLLYH